MVRPSIVEYKVGITGEDGVGKRSFATQFTLDAFFDEYDPTMDDSFRKRAMIDKQDCIIELVPIPSIVGYPVMRELYIRSCEAFILTYSITDRSSFVRAESYWWEEVLRVKVEMPCKTVFPKANAKDAKARSAAATTAYINGAIDDAKIVVVLVGCKSDCGSGRVVSYQEGEELAQKLGCPFFETSSKTGTNVEPSIFELIRVLGREHSEVKLRREAKAKGKVKSYEGVPLAAQQNRLECLSRFQRGIDQLFNARRTG